MLGGKCVVDSAFSRVLVTFLVESGQDHLSSSDSLEALQMDRNANSARISED